MKELPLSVAIAALIHENELLLIKRSKGDYAGLLGLPGGKIEKHEHVSDAATREIMEESGIVSRFKSHMGLVSEHLVENGVVAEHFLLHVCELEPKTTNITTDTAGTVAWFDLQNLEAMKNQIIPSDYLIIEKLVKNRERGYFNCVLEKNGEDYLLKKFESYGARL